MLGLASFLQHPLGFVVHSLPLGSSCLAPRRRFFLMTWPGLEKASKFFLSNWQIRGFQTSSTWAVHNANFPIQSTVGALFLGRGFAKLEDLGIAYVGDQLLRLFVNVLIFSVSFKSCKSNSLFGWLSNCWINLFDRFFAIRVALLDCRMRYPWYSIINVARCWFPRSRYALVVRRLSCFLLKLILLSTLRIRLQKNSRQPWRLAYFVVKLLFSHHAYCFLNTSRRKCVVENDCVWPCLILIAILSSGRALNCTNTLHVDEVSKYFCMVQSLACPRRTEFLPCFDRRPSGSLQ